MNRLVSGGLLCARGDHRRALRWGSSRISPSVCLIWRLSLSHVSVFSIAQDGAAELLVCVALPSHIVNIQSTAIAVSASSLFIAGMSDNVPCVIVEPLTRKSDDDHQHTILNFPHAENSVISHLAVLGTKVMAVSDNSDLVTYFDESDLDKVFTFSVSSGRSWIRSNDSGNHSSKILDLTGVRDAATGEVGACVLTADGSIKVVWLDKRQLSVYPQIFGGERLTGGLLRFDQTETVSVYAEPFQTFKSLNLNTKEVISEANLPGLNSGSKFVDFWVEEGDPFLWVVVQMYEQKYSVFKIQRGSSGKGVFGWDTVVSDLNCTNCEGLLFQRQEVDSAYEHLFRNCFFQADFLSEAMTNFISVEQTFDTTAQISSQFDSLLQSVEGEFPPFLNTCIDTFQDLTQPMGFLNCVNSQVPFPTLASPLGLNFLLPPSPFEMEIHSSADFKEMISFFRQEQGFLLGFVSVCDNESFHVDVLSRLEKAVSSIVSMDQEFLLRAGNLNFHTLNIAQGIEFLKNGFSDEGENDVQRLTQYFADTFSSSAIRKSICSPASKSFKRWLDELLSRRLEFVQCLLFFSVLKRSQRTRSLESSKHHDSEELSLLLLLRDTLLASTITSYYVNISFSAEEFAQVWIDQEPRKQFSLMEILGGCLQISPFVILNLSSRPVLSAAILKLLTDHSNFKIAEQLCQKLERVVGRSSDFVVNIQHFRACALLGLGRVHKAVKLFRECSLVLGSKALLRDSITFLGGNSKISTADMQLSYIKSVLFLFFDNRCFTEVTNLGSLMLQQIVISASKADEVYLIVKTVVVAHCYLHEFVNALELLKEFRSRLNVLDLMRDLILMFCARGDLHLFSMPKDLWGPLYPFVRPILLQEARKLDISIALQRTLFGALFRLVDPEISPRSAAEILIELALNSTDDVSYQLGVLSFGINLLRLDKSSTGQWVSVYITRAENFSVLSLGDLLKIESVWKGQLALRQPDLDIHALAEALVLSGRHTLVEKALVLFEANKIDFTELFAQYLKDCLIDDHFAINHDFSTSISRWQALEMFLNQVDGIHTNFRHMLGVCRIILSNGIRLPRFLFHKLTGSGAFAVKKSNPAALLRLLLEYDQLEDCSFILSNVFSQWSDSECSWIPVSLLKEVFIRLEGSHELKTFGRDLRAKLETKFERISMD
jgi:hypothetical protein